MITFPQRPKRGRILEIALVVSVAIHLLLGGFATYRYPMIAKLLERHLRQPNPQKMAALSTAITIEKRTRPRPAPPLRPQRALPVPPRPRIVPRVAVVPQPAPKHVSPPQPKPTEIARIVPHAKEVQRMSEQQIAEMEQRFARTIQVARANNDPTRVPPAAQPATMKRARLDIEGINDLMRRGEGILTPQDYFNANIDGDSRGTCYYVNYQIQFSDGGFDQGPVYWPICYPRRRDPFLNNWRGFPLPGPPAGWQPTQAQWSVIAAHPLLRLYFPDKFPDAASGN